MVKLVNSRLHHNQALSLLQLNNASSYCQCRAHTHLLPTIKRLFNAELSGISCASFHDFVCLNLKNSIFVENPSNKTVHNAETWVLDIGATDHIIHSTSLFTNVTSSLSSFMHLPNGEKVLVIHIGTVQLTPTLILENVICVPTDRKSVV